MADSQSLRLVFCTAGVHDHITEYVAKRLQQEGYDAISPSMLNFLGTLDCGVNYGSEIARRLNVSRQMVAKTVKELCRVGYLEQVQAKGKQKQIVFTASGEALMSRVRHLLVQLDEVLCKRLGEATLNETLSTLEAIQALLSPEL
ncbi:Bifunctional ligase/repressor BirA [Halomicronema hongdechloris C2206]|uniref:Bifunctional ligase/repressor BirA n=2 Tax=Halomicronema hongdechloris TaxID=1209493 RepID=A0A1Z3HSF5_9CYAN|nr:Bifunctional ligase/repressor BirA [Halomicronema hongdechloris C2206]